MGIPNIGEQVRSMLSRQISIERFFERLSERAQRVMVLADEEAALLNHHYVGTEHILLGLLREETGIAAKVLKGLGVGLEGVRGMVEQVVGRGGEDNEQPEESGRPMTNRALIVFVMAIGEAWRASVNVDTEHMLLALAREGEGLAAAAMENLGVSVETVRVRTYQTMMDPAALAEALREVIKGKGNVVTCRIADQDLDAIDTLIEAGIRSTRSDAASWLIHAGIEAHRPVLESVNATVAEIRQLRARAQALASQLASDKSEG